MALPRNDLPFYNLTLPVSKKVIKFRPFVVKEEKIMLIALQENDPAHVVVALNQIIENCTNNTVNVDSFPQIDIEYLFLNIRNKSLGEGVEVSAKCSHCEKKTPLVLDLSKVTINEGQKIDPTIKISDDSWIVVKYPSIRETYKLTTDNTDQTTMNILANSIVSIIQGEQTYTAEDSTFAERLDFVESLTQKQLKLIGVFFNNAPKMVYEDKFKCIACGTDNTILLEGLQNFFG